MRYVRTYPEQLPILRDLLPTIATPVLIIAALVTSWFAGGYAAAGNSRSG